MNRSKWNGIRAQTATGNMFVMSDHTVGGDNPDSCVAGDERGIQMRTTSNNTFEMIDAGVPQCSDVRKGCAEGIAEATEAFIRLRSGYGIQFFISDGSSQKNTNQQYLEILSPQKDNITRGPHVFTCKK